MSTVQHMAPSRDRVHSYIYFLPFWNSRLDLDYGELSFAIQLDFFCKMENFPQHIDKSENI